MKPQMNTDERRYFSEQTKIMFTSTVNCFLYCFSLCVLCVLCGANFLQAQGLPIAAPEAVGMNAAQLKLIATEVNAAIADKKLPGAVVIIGRKGKIVYRQAFGNRALVPQVEKMTVDTIFDVASLTKVVATTTSVMILVEQGKIRLNDTIGKFIPEIDDKDVKNVTIQQLLTHTSGFAPDFDLREKWTGNEGMLQSLKKEKLRTPAGTKFVYSDIGFIVLGEIVQRVEGKRLNKSVDFQFSSLKMYETRFVTYNIIKWNTETVPKDIISSELQNPAFYQKVAPTENIKGQQNYLGSKFEGNETNGNNIIRGFVHDPTANRMIGIAGHAGLFSTADDLARFCQMLLNGGSLDGKRILSAQTVAKMTAPIVVSETGNTRGFGWDINTAFSSNRGELFPLGSFGHTGFTGTSLWIDPTSQTFVVFMSNRVHPDGKGDVTPLRAKIATIAASAINDLTPEKNREAEARYYSSVAAQIPRFQDSKISDSKIPNSPTTDPQPLTTSVLNGIDVLEKENFKRLEGLRVGLVTNHTGRNRAGKQTIDLLFEAKNLKLTALFSPEHGIRGALDDKVTDSTDEKTGLPVYSLYGETRRPKPEQLKNLDALVFDIQDIGARFYTYSATLRNVMEEAAKAKIPVFVLDRPNPINGVDAEGSLADEDKLSFVAAHTIPVRHGLTFGELAGMMNEERKIGADLRVVKMENWRREMWFDQTNQTWINPSPNMRSLTEAALYPGIGLLETTNLSVGRGTDTPFEIIGAPWIDAPKLAQYLNERNINGVRFVPIKFTPQASVFKGEECSGINIIITDRRQFKPVRSGIEIAAALRKLFTEKWQVENYSKLLLNAEIFAKVKNSDAPEDLEKAWQTQLEEFQKRRAKFLLYQ